MPQFSIMLSLIFISPLLVLFILHLLNRSLFNKYGKESSENNNDTELIRRQRKEILDFEENELLFYAGEAYWKYYYELLEDIANTSHSIMIVMGNKISLRDDSFADAEKILMRCDTPNPEFKLNKERFGELSDLKYLHPIFEFWLSNLDRCTIFIKNTTDHDRFHCAIGGTSGIVFKEDLRDTAFSLPTHGRIFYGFSDYGEALERFYNIILNPNVCTRLTEKNALSVLLRDEISFIRMEDAPIHQADAA
ncbi:MAG: hypothetical protein R3F48_05065 [Candidatus Zixiibacteriota bacterium]